MREGGIGLFGAGVEKAAALACLQVVEFARPKMPWLLRVGWVVHDRIVLLATLATKRQREQHPAAVVGHKLQKAGWQPARGSAVSLQRAGQPAQARG